MNSSKDDQQPSTPSSDSDGKSTPRLRAATSIPSHLSHFTDSKLSLRQSSTGKDVDDEGQASVPEPGPPPYHLHLKSPGEITFIDPWNAPPVLRAERSDSARISPNKPVETASAFEYPDNLLVYDGRRKSSLHEKLRVYDTRRLSAAFNRLVQSESFWLGLYFLFNLGLTLYNKIVLVTFPFPYTLTAMHALCGSIGCYVLQEYDFYTPARLTGQQFYTLLAFSILYAINIAVSNLSLQLVTVPFHQVVRAASPLFTILLAYFLTSTHVSIPKLLSLLPVVAGVGFTTYGDYYFTTWGLILTLFGTFLASLKTVVTNILQSGSKRPLTHTSAAPRLFTFDKGFKLHPLDLLGRMSPLAFIQCVLYGWASGELNGVTRFGATRMSRARLGALFVNGMIAFGLNVVSFTANKKSGPLSISVAANVKQVLTMLLAVFIFNLVITPMNALGIALTLAGGAWYAVVEYQDKQRGSLVSLTSLPRHSRAGHGRVD